MFSMDRTGIYRIITTKYQTSANKTRTKWQFIFLEEIISNTSLEYINKIKDVYKRYGEYPIIQLHFNIKYNGYVWNNKNLSARLLTTNKGCLQDGIKLPKYGYHEDDDTLKVLEMLRNG